MLASMRPQAPHDPGIKLSEEFPNVGSFVILTPTLQDRIDFRDDLFGRQRNPPLGVLPDLPLEPLDRLLAWVRLHGTGRGTATQLAAHRGSRSPLLDLVPQKLEAAVNVHNPRFLRMQLHIELRQNSLRIGQCCLGLRFGPTGDDPIVRLSGQLIPPYSHLPVERSQENIAE
jgi:hypothetical protein